MWHYLNAGRTGARATASILAALVLAGGALAQDAPRHPERSGLGLEFSGDSSLIESAPGGRDIPFFDPRLSIFVTDVATMEQLKFADVMQQLAAGTATSRDELFRQWWDTNAQQPGLGLGAHCDDESAPVAGLSTLNGFAYRCPRPEAAEAAAPSADVFDADPANPAGYSAIAYSNRFDFAPVDGAHCGEYRVIFARNSGRQSALERNLIIFEAVAQNPAPADGLDGCRPIQEFWLALSDPAKSATQRGIELRDFYLGGLPAAGVGPIIARGNFAPATGQIRTNQFLHQGGANGFNWTLREFKIDDTGGTVKLVPEDVKSNPGVDLFRPASGHPEAAAFADAFVAEIPALRGGASGDESNILAFSFNTAEAFNSFESDASNPGLGDVMAVFAEAPASVLRDRIQAALTAGGSSLTPDNIVARAGVLTCAGCHEFSNGARLGGGLIWPASLGFTHVSESATEPGPHGDRFRISDALIQVLIPARQRVMLEYLSQFPGP